MNEVTKKKILGEIEQILDNPPVNGSGIVELAFYYQNNTLMTIQKKLVQEAILNSIYDNMDFSDSSTNKSSAY
jgi:hypothetical protein